MPRPQTPAATLLLLTALLAAATAPRPAAAARALQQSRPAIPLPMYGAWCGPGHSGGKAIDAIDSCCQAHDNCYDKSGYFDCGCDRQVLSCLGGVKVASTAVEANSFRQAATAYFRAAGCRNPGGAWSLPRPLAAMFGG